MSDPRVQAVENAGLSPLHGAKAGIKCLLVDPALFTTPTQRNFCTLEDIRIVLSHLHFRTPISPAGR